MRAVGELKRKISPFVFGSLSFLFDARSAFADDTIGSKIQEAMKDMVGPFLGLIGFLALIFGVYLIIKGLIELANHNKHMHTNQTSSVGLIDITMGTLLIMLPEFSGIGMMSFFGAEGLFSSADLQAMQSTFGTWSTTTGATTGLTAQVATMGSVGSVQSCLSLSGSAAITCMAKNVAENVAPIGVMAVFVIAFIVGLWQMGALLAEFANSDKGRGGATQGWWVKMAISILLMNSPLLFQAASQSLMGTSGTLGLTGIQSSSLLSYNFASSDFAAYNQMIGYVFKILVFFGAIAFVRGVFLLKDAAGGHGGQHASMGHAITFIVAGVLLANSKASTCIILNTLLGASAYNGAFGFCS